MVKNLVWMMDNLRGPGLVSKMEAHLVATMATRLEKCLVTQKGSNVAHRKVDSKDSRMEPTKAAYLAQTKVDPKDSRIEPTKAAYLAGQTVDLTDTRLYITPNAHEKKE